MTAPHIKLTVHRRIVLSLIIASVLFACGKGKTSVELWREAQALEREGRLTQAIETYEYALQRYPDSEEAAAMREAVTRLKKALQPRAEAAKPQAIVRTDQKESTPPKVPEKEDTDQKESTPPKVPEKEDAESPTIIMGKSVSGIQLGASRGAVEQALGEPSEVEDNTDIGGGLRWHFYDKGITVYFKYGDRVHGIYLFDDEGRHSRHEGKTEKGIGIGSPYDATIEAYGPPDVPGMTSAWYIGEWQVSFERDRSGTRDKVGRISILKRR